MTFTFDVK